MATFEDLITPLTPDQVREKIYQVLAALGVQTTGWKSGSVVRAIITAVAVVIAAFSHLAAKITRMGFLELSEGPWLTICARYNFDTERLPATRAQGKLTLTNTGGGDYTPEADDVIAIGGEHTYRNIEPFSLRPGESIDVQFRCTTPGSAGSVGAGEVDDLETPLLGVAVTNAYSWIGRDEETDEQLRYRARLAPAAKSPCGPREAYLYAALSARYPDGSPVGVTRAIVSRGSTNGTVVVTVATDTGALSADALAIVDAAVGAQAPLEVVVTAQSAIPHTLDIAYTAWCFTSLTDEAVSQLVEARLRQLFAAVPIGGFVMEGHDRGFFYLDTIGSAIVSGLPSGWHVALTSPATAVPLAPDAVVQLGSVSADIRRREAA